jgi:hypothetical protein
MKICPSLYILFQHDYEFPFTVKRENWEDTTVSHPYVELNQHQQQQQIVSFVFSCFSAHFLNLIDYCDSSNSVQISLTYPGWEYKYSTCVSKW